MATQDDDTGGKPIEVVLRFAGKDGAVDMTGIQRLEAGKHSFVFKRKQHLECLRIRLKKDYCGRQSQ